MVVRGAPPAGPASLVAAACPGRSLSGASALPMHQQHRERTARLEGQRPKKPSGRPICSLRNRSRKSRRTASLAGTFAAALPLLKRGQVAGVLVVYSGELAAFQPEVLALLAELVREVGHGLEHVD